MKKVFVLCGALVAVLLSGCSTVESTQKFNALGLGTPNEKAVCQSYVQISGFFFFGLPIIVGSPVVIECELIEFVETAEFTTVLGRVVNLAADESVLGENGKIDTGKIGMIFYESFSNSYYTLGEKVGKAWGEGKVFLNR